MPATLRAQLGAAVDPPDGAFRGAYREHAARARGALEHASSATIVRGAVMMFQDEHGLTVDGIAGPQGVARAARGRDRRQAPHEGYSYVYVHRTVPQSLTLWHNGRTIFTSPGNTGVPAAPTQLGTFPCSSTSRSAR